MQSVYALSTIYMYIKVLVEVVIVNFKVQDSYNSSYTDFPLFKVVIS